MGVKGLLPCLRSITRPVPLERYRGLTVAVDAMSWLHKGVYAGDVRTLAKHQWNEKVPMQTNNAVSATSRRIDFEAHAEKRYADRGRSAAASEGSRAAAASAAGSKCVAFTMRHADALRRDYGMDIVMVIDGGSLPSKSEIDRSRREDRRQAFEDALAAEARGDGRNARKLYARACSITHQMRHELIQFCKRAGINFVVAPYEADAQMAQLAHSGAVDLVITEDSDLLAYGCPRVLFKVDFDAGRGDEVQLMRDLAVNDDPSFRNWTHDMFVYMCIVNGCDYCEGVPGIGIKTAHKLVRLHRTPSKIFNALRLAGKMPKDFEESFWRAYRTFRHQRVYNQESEQIEPLLPIDETRVDGDTRTIWPFLGPWVDPEVAKAIATGEFHPVKKVPWNLALENNAMVDVTNEARQDFWPTLGNESHRQEAQRRSEVTERNRENMFKFFPSKKGKDREKEEEAPLSPLSRPPLEEIFLNGDRPCGKGSSVGSDNAADRSRAQPIPIHFNEYSSSLVGATFETLSRRSKGPTSGRRNVSRAVQHLRESARTKIKARHQSKEAGRRSEDAKPLMPDVGTIATVDGHSSTNEGDPRRNDELPGDRKDWEIALFCARPPSQDGMVAHDVYHDELTTRHDFDQRHRRHSTDGTLNCSVDMRSNEWNFLEQNEEQMRPGAGFKGVVDDASYLNGPYGEELEDERCPYDDSHFQEVNHHCKSARTEEATDVYSTSLGRDDVFFGGTASRPTYLESNLDDGHADDRDRDLKQNNTIDMSLELYEDERVVDNLLHTRTGVDVRDSAGLRDDSRHVDATSGGRIGFDESAPSREDLWVVDGCFGADHCAPRNFRLLDERKSSDTDCTEAKNGRTHDLEPLLDSHDESPKDVFHFFEPDQWEKAGPHNEADGFWNYDCMQHQSLSPF